MARKGDIDSKSIASRVPMEVYLRLQATASKNKMTLSAYVNQLLSIPHYDNGGKLKNVVSAEKYNSLKNEHIELQKTHASLKKEYEFLESLLRFRKEAGVVRPHIKPEE